MVGLEVACLLRIWLGVVTRRAASQRFFLTAPRYLNLRKERSGPKRLVLRGGCPYVYRDVNKSLVARHSELSQLDSRHVRRACPGANPPAALPDERDRAYYYYDGGACYESARARGVGPTTNADLRNRAGLPAV